MFKYVVITEAGGMLYAKGFEWATDAIKYQDKILAEMGVRSRLACLD